MKLSVVLLSSIFILGSAFAELPARSLTWDQLKTSCESPNAFGRQNAPQNIKVHCEDVQLAWRPVADGTLNLSRTRMMRSSVTSSKYVVNAQSNPSLLPSEVGTCTRFVQVRETTNVTVDVSCKDLVAYKGDLASFCTEQANQTRAQDAELVEVEELSATIDTCPVRPSTPSRPRNG